MVAEKFAQAYARVGVAPPGGDGYHVVGVEAAAEAAPPVGGKSRKFRITRNKRTSETVGSKNSNKKTRSKK
jgi:hypothetical protein